MNTTPKVVYPNYRSRLLIGRMFERQFVVPDKPSRVLEAVLTWYENWFLKVDVSQIQVDRPVFLIGLPRSGTSMLQDLFCLHPEVAYITHTMHCYRRCFCAAEVLRRKFDINAVGERYLGDSVIVHAGGACDAVITWGEWLGWDPVSLEYKPRKIEDFTDEEIEAIKMAIRRVVWCFGERGKRFFTKNPGLIPDMVLLGHLFPDAKFIHIVRDPRMCANSLLKLYRRDQEQLARVYGKRRHWLYDTGEWTPYPRVPRLAEYVEQYGPSDIRTTAHLWNEAITFINERRDRLPSYYEVRYEDILADPKEEVMRVMEYCDLPPIESGNAAFWDKLDQVGVIHHTNKYGQFQVIEEICQENMKRYGYC